MSRQTERMMQPIPKVRKSRLTDGIVAVPAAMMAATATKVNKGMASSLRMDGQTKFVKLTRSGSVRSDPIARQCPAVEGR